MDVRAGEVVVLMGEHVTDRGLSLQRQYGQVAADAGAELFATVTERLDADPGGAENVRLFTANPGQFAAPMVEVLDSVMQTDADFTVQVGRIIGALEAAQPGAIGRIVTASDLNAAVGDPFDPYFAGAGAAAAAGAAAGDEFADIGYAPPGPIAIADDAGGPTDYAPPPGPIIPPTGDDD
jgi:hypothetical protein